MSLIKLRTPALKWANPAVPEYNPMWYFKIRFRGKQILRCTGTTVKAEAGKIEGAVVRGLHSENWARALEAMEGAKLRRSLCTIGEIAGRYLDPAVKLLKDEKQARRNVNDLFLVLAWALDLWVVHAGGTRGVKIGERIPDRGRIGGLAASVLTGKLVKDYFTAKHGGRLNLNEELEGNASINSTLGHARDVFSPKAVSYKFEGLALPDLKGFLEEPLLPVLQAVPEPVKEAEFSAMVAGASAMGGELELVNMIFRQTGLRSGSVLGLHRDWLERLRDGWWLHVRVRKGKTALYSIPVGEELAGRILSRPGLTVLPGGTEGERLALVNGGHNEWLKGIIGGAGGRGQGNHRLRDTVACVLRSWLGMEVAVEALGHADAKTTMKHYAKLRMDVSDLMRAELGAFQRVRPVVVPFVERVG